MITIMNFGMLELKRNMFVCGLFATVSARM